QAPLAICGNVGRHPESVAAVTELAELVGMRVADTRGPLNLPYGHPLFVDNAAAAIREADVLLLLDVDVPWIPRHVAPPDGARIAQIDIDPLKESIALWGFPVDLPIQADSSKALPGLVAALQARATPADRERWTARRNRLIETHAAEERVRRGALDGLRN